MATIDVLLDGWNLRSNVGSVGWCSIALVTGQKRILVDAGHVGRRTALLDALKQRGLTSEDIDVTVMTHAHWDHSQNYDLFYHAPALIHRWELKYAHKPHPNDWATPQWTGAMIDDHPRAQEVEEGYEIEPGISVIHTPGHSPGSMGLLVETGDGLCAVTGDAIHYGEVALSGISPIVFWNEEDSRKSIKRVLDTADIVYPGHDRPFRMVKEGRELEYLSPPVELAVSGITPDMEGVSFNMDPRAPFVMPGIEDQTVESLGRLANP